MSGNRHNKGKAERGECTCTLSVLTCSLSRSINQSNCKATCNKTGHARWRRDGGNGNGNEDEDGGVSRGLAQYLCLINVAVVRCCAAVAHTCHICCMPQLLRGAAVWLAALFILDFYRSRRRSYILYLYILF